MRNQELIKLKPGRINTERRNEGEGVQEMKRGRERMGEERERVNERESSVPWSRRKNL